MSEPFPNLTSGAGARWQAPGAQRSDAALYDALERRHADVMTALEELRTEFDALRRQLLDALPLIVRASHSVAVRLELQRERHAIRDAVTAQSRRAEELAGRAKG